MRAWDLETGVEHGTSTRTSETGRYELADLDNTKNYAIRVEGLLGVTTSVNV